MLKYLSSFVLYIYHAGHFWFPTSDHFRRWMYSSHLRVPSPQNTRTWVSEIPRAICQQKLRSENQTIWSSVHDNSVIANIPSIMIESEKSRNNKTLDTRALTEAGKFSHSWIDWYGPTVWSATPHELAPLDVFLWRLMKDQMYRNPDLPYQNLYEGWRMQSALSVRRILTTFGYI